MLGRAIIALIIKFPELAHFRDDNFDIKDVQFFNEEMANLKDSVIGLIEEEHEVVTENLFKALENFVHSNDLNDLKNVLASIQSLTLDSAQTKLSTLLLKDLLLQVDQQYKEALSRIDEIETHQTAITNQKIKEISDYKASLEQKILSIEKDLT